MSYSIAIVGFGTVGGGVASILSQEDIGIKISKILVRSLDASEDIDTKGVCLDAFTTDFTEIVEDKSIQTIVETIGGLGAAKIFIEQSLRAGKNVVTANKALLATHGNELFALAKKYNVELRYESAVAGSIPIVHILQTQYAPKGNMKISGIINGTCNYMLTELEKGGAEYADVLKLAQQKGFAESDPTADVEGIDAAQKLVILSALAFGGNIQRWEDVERTGISHLTAQDFINAHNNNQKIRLIASAEKLTSGEIEMKVFPELGDKNGKFGQIMGAENGVLIENKYTGKSFFAGQGAGALPTAMAVISDVVSLRDKKQ